MYEELNLRLAILRQELSLQLALDEVSDRNENAVIGFKQLIALLRLQLKLKIVLVFASENLAPSRQQLNRLVDERDWLVHCVVECVEHAGGFVGYLRMSEIGFR